MSTIQKFTWNWPGKDQGKPFISLTDWVNYLSKEQQEDFYKAQARQHQHRQEAIDQGLMVVDHKGYIWRDEATAIQGKPSDLIWLEYTTRYSQETGVELVITYINEE